MCVSAAPANFMGTRAFTWQTLGHPDEQHRSWHVTAYQNAAENWSPDPNCMLLHFPGSHIALVDGPQHTRYLMADVTRGLPQLVDTSHDRGFMSLGDAASVIQDYGDYTVVLAQYPRDILAVLDQVPEQRRPKRTTQLEALVDWYQFYFPDYVFALACFARGATPAHPIVVEYVPDNDDVFFIPGLDCHTGEVPKVGARIPRDFQVAFGTQLHDQPTLVGYSDDEVEGSYWAPKSVVGFHDNRLGLNLDYAVPRTSIEDGLTGADLAKELFS